MKDRQNILSAIRNPLSIIALFVLFIEVIASLTMTSNSLNVAQRSWFVVFCTIFPLLVLIAFFLIAWFRPVNFYGPQDYSDDSIFLKLMRQGKIEDEVEEVKQSEDVQKPESKMTIVSKVKAAEDKAVEELRKEFKTEIYRDETSLDGNFLFDAVIGKGKNRLFVEVKYIAGGALGSMTMDSIRKFSKAVGNTSKILAIVYSGVLLDATKQRISDEVSKIDNSIELRYYKL